MNEHGVIVLKAESSVEAYALRKWMDEALVRQDDINRRETFYWRGSRLLVDPNVSEAKT